MQEENMSNRERNELYLRNLTRDIVNKLLANSDKWPDDWDGVEMRELLYRAAEQERIKVLMGSGSGKRARVFKAHWVGTSLY